MRVLCGLVMLALPCVAAADEAAARAMLDEFDRDGDGALSAEEFRNGLLRRFHDRDQDGDGVLAGKELTHGSEPVRLEDFSASIQGHFADADANGDGSLGVTELAGWLAGRRKQP